MKMRYLAIAAALAVSPLATAFAQGTGPNTKADTAESTAIKKGAAANPHQPGATGSTVVTGDKSTVAGDHKATAEQKTGASPSGK